MKLTGTPFFVLALLLVPLSVGLLMYLWNRVRGPRAARFGVRLLMVAFTQFTAVTLVFVMVNNDNQLYGSWDDLLGTGSHVRAVPVPPPTDATAAANAPDQPKVVQQFTSVDDNAVPKDVKRTELKGRVSGVDGEVLVWTPPQYDDPAYKDKKFPVVELLVGFPGSSSAWFGSMNVSKQLAPLMKSGQVAPFILVSPRVVLLGSHVDTGCADVPGKVNAETWLARDVTQMVLDNFRAEPGADHWAVAGYSAGGHCAMRLAVGHPNRYHAGVSMSGYNDPMGESDSLTAKDAHLRDVSNPLHMLQQAQTPPPVALYVTGKKGDGFEDALALQKAAKAPTAVTPVEVNGPHLTSTWEPLVPSVFTWLTQTVGKTG
ncbi:esterase family protein [Streptomyces rubellomurinus]|uniref:Esterase n=2 Tax=Streptomyces TaxID=1883 RepID=A0A0F2TG97_STRR3|nr:alpha/beta hydrolase-fold protein [Streptomyces rubellomurinus]KJS55922.1 esterase [Streptomyces rubellomurinus subsp. indigoferus]KJS61566.1 esterase [Streptomyces rubellomurinus]